MPWHNDCTVNALSRLLAFFVEPSLLSFWHAAVTLLVSVVSLLTLTLNQYHQTAVAVEKEKVSLALANTLETCTVYYAQLPKENAILQESFFYSFRGNRN